MASTNITINQQSGISINVETLQAIKQRVLRIMTNGPLDPMGRLRSKTEQEWSLVNGQWSITRLYRHQLRMTRAVAQMIDKHPTLSNIAIWLMGIALAFEIFMFA